MWTQALTVLYNKSTSSLCVAIITSTCGYASFSSTGFSNIFSLLFSFIMPSSLGRIVLLLPIAVIIAKNFGFKEHDNGYVGIMLAFIFSTVIPAFAILPANVPNMILSGLTHEIYGFELLYSHYLVANFFVLGFIKNIIIVAMIYFIYHDTVKPSILKSEKNFS